MTPVALNLGLLYKKNQIDTKKEESMAEQVYSHDNSLGNLFFELEELHLALSKDKIKVVYVIDEIDKLKKPADFFKKLFVDFKNLFTLSSAIFVFVGEQTIFDIFTQLSKDERPPEYTYFTTKYFLARPTYDELSLFLDDIVENLSEIQSNETDKQDFEQYKRFLCFRAKGDFYDLLQQIKDNVVSFTDGYPVIEVKGFGGENLSMARYQKAVSVVFDSYCSGNPSKWVENEKILKTLYTRVYDLMDAGKFILEIDEKDKKISAESMATKDLGVILRRLGVLDKPQENRSMYNPELHYKKITYTYILSDGSISEVPDKFSDKTQFEQIFIDEKEKLEKLMTVYQYWHESLSDNNRDNVTPFSKKIYSWGIAHPGIDVLSIQQNIDDGVAYKRDDVENFTKKVQDTYQSTLQNAHLIFANMIRSAVNETQSTNLSQNNDVFNDLSDNVRELIKTLNHIVVFTPGYKKQILIGGDDVHNSIKRQKLDWNKYFLVFISVKKKTTYRNENIVSLQLEPPDFWTELSNLRDWLKKIS